MGYFLIDAEKSLEIRAVSTAQAVDKPVEIVDNSMYPVDKSPGFEKLCQSKPAIAFHCDLYLLFAEIVEREMFQWVRRVKGYITSSVRRMEGGADLVLVRASIHPAAPNRYRAERRIAFPTNTSLHFPFSKQDLPQFSFSIQPALQGLDVQAGEIHPGQAILGG